MVNAEFGFAAGRSWDNFRADGAVGGGGLMDVGTYCTSFAAMVAGENADEACYHAEVTEKGYDAFGSGALKFPGGLTAAFSTGIHANLANDARIYGEEGSIHVPSPWKCSGGDVVLKRSGKDAETFGFTSTNDELYGLEADAVAASLESGRMPAHDPRRHSRQYADPGQAPSQRRPSFRLRTDCLKDSTAMPETALQIPTAPIPHLDKPMPRIVCGTDFLMGQAPSQSYAALDAYWEAGGRAFDTAHCYGMNTNLFGTWVKARGVADETIFFDKGCHPYGSPRVTHDDMRQDIVDNHDRLGVEYTEPFPCSTATTRTCRWERSSTG